MILDPEPQEQANSRSTIILCTFADYHESGHEVLYTHVWDTLIADRNCFDRTEKQAAARAPIWD